MPRRGDLVWGKLKSFSWWPAIIIDPNDCGRDAVAKDKRWLFWFGDHKVSEVDCMKIVDFKEFFHKNSKKLGKLFKCAVEEALTIYAERHRAQFTDQSKLLKWANSGFKSFLDVSYKRKQKITGMELPKIVYDALQSLRFKRQLEKTSDSDDEINDILEDVRKGLKSLREICIACCKPKVKIIMQHPLFAGGVCQCCKKYITTIMKMVPGKSHDICVVCGLGGIIVFCNNQHCLRSYCKLCIEYLVSEESYINILQNNDWQCYICEKDQDSKCLIQRRELCQYRPVPTPSHSNEKLPIRVIAHNNAALTVLKDKKLEVSVYCTEPSYIMQPSSSHSLSFLPLYADFSHEEFATICADLIYGSFFGCSTEQDQKKWLKLFASTFFRFLFRLDNAKLFNPFVYFIFISEANMLDTESMRRVLRFLEVHPLSIEHGNNKLFIWCNIPDSAFLENYKFSKREINVDKPIEEKILSKFMEPLKCYFKAIP